MEFELARNNDDDDVSRAAGCDQSADGLASQADGFFGSSRNPQHLWGRNA